MFPAMISLTEHMIDEDESRPDCIYCRCQCTPLNMPILWKNVSALDDPDVKCAPRVA